MTAWLQAIDLDTFAIERLALPPSLERWWIPPAGAPLALGGSFSAGATGLARGAQRWAIDPRTAPGGAIINGRIETRHTFTHGDVLHTDGRVVIFLETPRAAESEAEARLLENPDDPDAVRVWADWLLEHGDPLGQHLLSPTPLASVLEGLDRLVEIGALELSWRHGLIDAATFRATERASWVDHVTLLRFLSLRVARWTRQLTVDLTPWTDATPARIERSAAIALRVLLTGPRLECLEGLSLGAPLLADAPSHSLAELIARLPARFPRLKTDVAALLAPGRRGVLRVRTGPRAVDFFSPDARADRIALDRGVWVGSSQPGSLRALAPGTPRSGVSTAFVIAEAAPHWRLLPEDSDVRLNGRKAHSTRLLPGDVLETSEGVSFRYELD